MLDFLAGCILFSYFILFWVFIVVCLGFFFQYPLCIHIYYISPLLRISRKKKQTNQPKIPQTPTKLWRRRVGPYCTFLINGKTKFLLTRCGRERGPTRITTGARCVFSALRDEAAASQVARSRSQNSSGSLPIVPDPFLCRGWVYEWQAAAAPLERHRRTGTAAGAKTRGFANIPFQSAAKRDYTELSSTPQYSASIHASNKSLF